MIGISSAWAADTAEHGHDAHGSLLTDPTFWVAVSFVIFLLIAGKKIYQGLTKMLDDRTALIARTLSEVQQTAFVQGTVEVSLGGLVSARYRPAVTKKCGTAHDCVCFCSWGRAFNPQNFAARRL